MNLTEVEEEQLSRESMSIRLAVEAIGIKEVFDEIGVSRIIEVVGVERILDEIPREKILEKLDLYTTIKRILEVADEKTKEELKELFEQL